VTEYEILLLLDAELPDERQEEIVSRARALIEQGGGQFGAHDAWGRRKLAYEIDRKAEGSYHLLTFASEPAALEEVSRVLKITDGVLRHLAVRRPRAGRAPEARRPAAPAAQRPAPDSGPVEGAGEAREVPSATSEPPTDTPEEAVSAGRAEE
jgi:small subunit ribosomal protein S6